MRALFVGQRRRGFWALCEGGLRIIGSSGLGAEVQKSCLGQRRRGSRLELERLMLRAGCWWRGFGQHKLWMFIAFG
jgi:hypothetical protein